MSIEKTIIGRQEFCDLPQLGLKKVRARIDSGARTTSLHAYNIEIIKGEHGEKLVKFNTHPENYRRKTGPSITIPLTDKRRIVSSNGESEDRYIVYLDIKMGTKRLRTQVTLSSRHKMSFPILIGRNTIIQGDFLIDVSKKNTLKKARLIKKKKEKIET